MMSFFSIFRLRVVLLAVLLCCSVSAFSEERALKLVPAKENASEKRFALLIGNNAYAGKAALLNPRNDAEDLGKTLKGMNFNVRLALDANRDGMNQAIRAFQSDLQANPGAVALFYYAGHGMEIEGTNYLIPVGKEFDGPESVKEDAISAQSLLARMQAGRARVSLVLLDACRDNPWGARGSRSVAGSGGLAVMQAPAGFLIAFAAQPGKTASDGNHARNGLFTSKLIEEIKKPQAIYEVFNKVRDEVHKESGGLQLPEEKNVLTGETLYLAGKPAAPTIGGLKAEQVALLGKAIQGDADALKAVRSIPALAKLLQMTSSGNTDMQTAAFLVQQQSSKNPDRRALAIATETYMRERLQTINELKQLDEQGNPFAVLMLDRLYDNGRTFASKDAALSRQYAAQGKEAGVLVRLKSLAAGGDAVAMYWLASVNRYASLEEPASAAGSFEWAQKSADAGYLPAYYFLATSYINGVGKDRKNKDEEKGMQVLLRGAQAGSPECMLELAILYSSSRDRSWVSRDFKQAVFWGEKAVATGYLPALTRMGYIFERGLGVEKNEKAAFGYYKQAADLGVPEGIYNVARWYEYGMPGARKNEEEALKLYKALSDMGYTYAFCKLGQMYGSGRGGVTKDITAAVDWYQRGVKLGNAYCAYSLAWVYERGGGVAKNEAEALRLYKIAAERDVFGQYHMGRLYENGLLGLPKDKGEAIKWYSRAADYEPLAAQALKRLQ